MYIYIYIERERVIGILRHSAKPASTVTIIR